MQPSGGSETPGLAAFRCVERLGVTAAQARSAGWRHRLFHGDNRDVLRFIAAEFSDAVDLVYIDPPFDIGLDFGLRVSTVGGVSIEMPAYSDRWTAGAGSHAHMMWERLHLMRGILKSSGFIFLHCDWRSSAVMRLLLDEVFGPRCFRNEIIWRRAPNLGRQAASNQLGRVAESILVYSAKPGTRFPGAVPARSEAVPMDANGRPRGTQWDPEHKAYFTTAPRGDYTDRSVARLRAQGRIHDTPSGRVYVKYFLRQGEGGRWYKDQPVDTIWDDPDVRPLRHCSREELAVGYATQKPEGLLHRIIAWASPPGGLVADLFCGSGTTGVVAGRLGRRWIMADASPVAIRIARGRLLARSEQAGAEPGAAGGFDVFHPDHGEHSSASTSSANDRVRDDRRLVLDAFGAIASDQGDPRLHAALGDWAVHVDASSEPLDRLAIESVATAAAHAGFRGLHCLADRFESALHRLEPASRVFGGLPVRLVPIPRHALRTTDSGHSSWSGLPAIIVDARVESSGAIRVELRQCLLEERGAGGSPDPLAAIEWWGVERIRGGELPFTPEWQYQRTWRRNGIESVAVVADDEPMRATSVRVGVMDVFGCLWRLEVPVERR